MGLICRSLSASASAADPVERPSLLLAIHGANVAARTAPFSHSSARPCPMRSLSYRPLPVRSAARYDSGSCCNRALLRLEAFYRRVDICERFPVRLRERPPVLLACPVYSRPTEEWPPRATSLGPQACTSRRF